MTIEFLTWILIMFSQTAQLGIAMYTLICLSDLENDFLNPHDASDRINKWVVVELSLQAVVVAFYLVNQAWLLALLPIGIAVWMLRDYQQGKSFVDVTEIFRNTDKEKKRRLIKLACHVVVFMLSTYKLVSTAVGTLQSAAGKALTKQLFKGLFKS